MGAVFLSLAIFCGCDEQQQTETSTAAMNNTRQLAAADTEYPPRLRREDSFLGIHFDFHANDGDKEIGKNVTEEMVENIIRKVRPDYIQVDCKGHAGRTSYPTKVGNQAGGFVGDPLKIWREVTARNGVSLYMHYSGVWDTKAVELHPEWARVKPDGTRDDKKTSVFGPYVDELLIPQLKELRDEYGVDGYWIDGECWAVENDYSDAAIKAFNEQTGIVLEEYPKDKKDDKFRQFQEFQRQAFRDYVDHYVTELHEHDPGVQVASNWAFSSLMFEPVTVDVDFLSGDYPMQDSVRSGRYEARCLRHQGKPWDLMAWGFSAKWEDIKNRSIKTPVQLKREAAVVLSTGGGFQAYFNQNRDGSIRDWHMNVMGEVAEFCRARQDICHKAESVPQVCLFYSTESMYRKMDRPFNPAGLAMPIKGILWALLDNQLHVDIKAEHHLKGNMSEYPVIVIPEWQYIAPDLHAEFIEYVKNGGSLLIIGPVPANIFKEELGIEFEEDIAEKTRWLLYDGIQAGHFGFMRNPVLGSDVQPVGRLYSNDQPVGEYEIAGTVRKLGRGKIAAIYMNMGYRYHIATTAQARDFIGGMVREIFDEPMVEVTGSSDVDLVVNRKDGRLAVNLVNTAGPHANKEIYTFDNIPPVGPLTVKIRLDEKPRSIVMQPQGRKMNFTWKGGVAQVEPFMLDIHDILVVE